MSSSQPSGSSTRSPSGGGGSADTIIPILFWCFVLGTAGPAALAAVSGWVIPQLQRSSSAAARFAAEWWAQYQVVVVFWMVAAFVLFVWRLWTRRRDRRRRLQWAALADGLAPRMGKDWDPAKHLRVRRWRGLRPVVVRAAVTVTPKAMDREWKLAVTAAVRDLLGRVAPVSWPKPPAGLVAWRKPPWVEIQVLVPPPRWRRVLSNLWLWIRRRPPAEDLVEDSAAAADLEEKLISALVGLVPTPRPKVSTDQLVVEYGETTRDQSPSWRARVVDQVSARLGAPFRATWDRQRRSVCLQPVPVLPHPIDWSEQTAALQGLDFGPFVAPYGTDENGCVVAWQPGDREVHALFSGDPGTGKTESMKAVINSLLMQGALVAIIDPKQQDFAEYLGRPGVVCVATAVEDQVGALIDLEAEMMRRTSAKALARLAKQFPETASPDAGDARYHTRRGAPAQAAVDEVPLILVLDELTFHVAQVQEWWQRLSTKDRAEWGAEKSRQAPMLTIPSRVVALARAIKMHALFGLQRVDANNFGGSTAMRDNIRHMSSMGRQSRIGSEMQWGDGRTGSDVEINNAGEGMSNGLRLDPSTGERLGRGVPGRFKAWYAADVAETSQFWDRVAAVAPDASLIRLPHVSDAARDPAAAAAALRARAYEEYADHFEVASPDDDLEVQPPAAGSNYLRGIPASPTVSSGETEDPAGEEAPELVWDPRLAEAASVVVSKEAGSAAMLQRELRVGYERGRQLMSELETIGVVGPVQGKKARSVLIHSSDQLSAALQEHGVIPPVSPPQRRLHVVPDTAPPADQVPAGNVRTPDDPDSATGDVDDDGNVWEPIPVGGVLEGDVIQVGDIAAGLVLDAPGMVVDDFDGAEVVRLVLQVDGTEEVVDFSEDDVVYRRIAAD